MSKSHEEVDNAMLSSLPLHSVSLMKLRNHPHTYHTSLSLISVMYVLVHALYIDFIDFHTRGEWGGGRGVGSKSLIVISPYENPG